MKITSKKITSKKIAAVVLAGSMLFTASCGSLLYPQRMGQTSGNIDPVVALLNGVGVVFYILPGLIAFAVDFANGTIYLPNSANAADANSLEILNPSGEFITVRVPSEHFFDELTAQRTLGNFRAQWNPSIDIKLNSL